MIKELSLEDFRKRNNISEEKWEKANISWEDLKSIGVDHENSIPDLNGIAEFIANTLQKCKSVHSVKWRIKDSEHLMAKIIRKRAEGSEKYVDIDITNYSSKITDLVGVRVLHLFKNEQLKIDEYLCSKWKPEEKIKYIREGDEKKEDKNNKESRKVEDKNDKNSGRIEVHPNNYRSTHYIISSKPTLKEVFSEIQVRTIFEEGWSEIDHKIRYPNFSNNPIVSYFLDIFNRIAGTADEMGDFLNELRNETLIKST